jgi:UDP-2,3-diacylglucosamine pyrophosphatase LpxH
MKASADRIKLVISDFHLSAGKWLPDGRRNPLEDFHQDDRLSELLDHYGGGQYENIDVELIINGDFFDPLAMTTNSSEFPAEVTEAAAVRTFQRISEAHPTVFEALSAFSAREN